MVPKTSLIQKIKSASISANADSFINLLSKNMKQSLEKEGLNYQVEKNKDYPLLEQFIGIQKF